MSEDLTEPETHFAFGRNWASYAERIGETEIAEAERGLLRLTGGRAAGGQTIPRHWQRLGLARARGIAARCADGTFSFRCRRTRAAPARVGGVGSGSPDRDRCTNRPHGGYETFFEAAALLHKTHPQVRFVCVGDGPAGYRQRLREHAKRLGLEKAVIWAGARQDMPALYSAFDVASSSSSYGEGFSNAIAEAMACGRLCVVTDVGDSPLPVGNAGWVVPPCNAPALAQAWVEVLALPPAEVERLSFAARQRIETLFSVSRMVDKTGRVLGCW